MLKKLIDRMPNKIWKVLAFVIVMLLVGPEIFAGIELMVMVELMGADAFILLTLSSFFTLTIKPIFQKFINFEKKSGFFIPSKEMIMKQPLYLLSLIPGRTCKYAFSIFICFVVVECSFFYYQGLLFWTSN